MFTLPFGGGTLVSLNDNDYGPGPLTLNICDLLVNAPTSQFGKALLRKCDLDKLKKLVLLSIIGALKSIYGLYSLAGKEETVPRFLLDFFIILLAINIACAAIFSRLTLHKYNLENTPVDVEAGVDRTAQLTL